MPDDERITTYHILPYKLDNPVKASTLTTLPHFNKNNETSDIPLLTFIIPIIMSLKKGGFMGPFHTPWLTFSAWIVSFLCIIFSILWAILWFKPGEDDE